MSSAVVTTTELRLGIYQHTIPSTISSEQELAQNGNSQQMARPRIIILSELM
jgi:hypothetical protein